MEVSASVSYFLPQFVVRVLLSLGNKIIEQEDTDGELEATVGEMTQSENREDTVGEQNKIEEHDYLGEQESTAGCSSTVSVERSVPRDSGRIRPDLVVVEDIIADTEEEYMDVTPIEKETDIGTLTLCKDDKDVSQLQCPAVDCSFRMDKWSKIRAHGRIHHAREELFQCPDCPKRHCSREGSRIHVMSGVQLTANRFLSG